MQLVASKCKPTSSSSTIFASLPLRRQRRPSEHSLLLVELEQNLGRQRRERKRPCGISQLTRDPINWAQISRHSHTCYFVSTDRYCICSSENDVICQRHLQTSGFSLTTPSAPLPRLCRSGQTGNASGGGFE